MSRNRKKVNSNKKLNNAAASKPTNNNKSSEKPITRVEKTYNDRDLNRANSSKNQRRQKEVINTVAEEMVSESNPPAWYMKFLEFAKDAARLPFATPLGATLTNLWNDYTSTTGTKISILNQTPGGTTNPWTVPGIMRIGFAPTFGVSTGLNSPTNRSSLRFYTFLRSVQKASWEYDHQDATMMLYAMDSLYMFHALMKRCYGVLRTVTPMNRYYQKALVQAMGFDFENLKSNIANFRDYINQFAIDISAYIVPTQMDLFNRHEWMCTGLYTDSTSSRAQTYMFVPDGFWQYSNTGSTGSQLDWKPWVTTSTNPAQAGQMIYHTFSDVVAFGESLWSNVAGDNDFTYISADIYNLLGQGRQLEHVGDLYTVVPSYSEMVLSQIENARIVGYFTTDCSISQDPSVNNGAILTQYITTPSAANGYDAMRTTSLNFHHDSPSEEEVIEATRLSAIVAPNGEPGASSNFGSKIVQCGTEVVTQIKMWSSNGGSTQQYVVDGTASNTLVETSITTSIARDMVLMDMCQFDWAPQMYLVEQSSSFTEPYDVFYVGTTTDIDNYALIPDDQLANIHEAALYSEFNIV